MTISTLHFIILGLATWRCSRLLAEEEGPFGIFTRLRHALGVRYVYNEVTKKNEYVGYNVVAKGILCTWCNSIWVATLWLIYYHYVPATFYLALICALSAVSIIVDTFVD